MSYEQYPGRVAPSNGLAIASLVLAILLPPVGFILAIIARHQAQNNNYEPSVLTTVAMVVSMALLVIGVIFIIALLVGAATIQQL